MPLPPGRGTCSVDGCTLDIFTNRGWCQMHYQRWRTHQDPAYERPQAESVCSEPECSEPSKAKGLCLGHYQQAQYRQRRLVQGKPEPLPARPACEMCGETFLRLRRQKYCGVECGRLARQLYAIERDYGLSEDDFYALRDKQGGLCAICGHPDRSAKAILHVDHCHDTGKVRGLLCHHCNVGLGHFRNDPALLSRAATYLGT